MTDALFISFFFQSLSLVSHASSRCFSFSDFQNSLGVPHLHKFVRGDAVSNRASCCDYVISIVPQTTFVRYFCCAYWFHLMYWFLPRVGISCLWQLKLSSFFFCCFRLMLLPRHLTSVSFRSSMLFLTWDKPCGFVESQVPSPLVTLSLLHSNSSDFPVLCGIVHLYPVLYYLHLSSPRQKLWILLTPGIQ